MKSRYSFKRLFWSYTFCTIPLSILAAFLALFNVLPIEFNGTPRYGIQGFIITILYIPFFSLTWGAFNWLALSFGGMLYDGFLTGIKRTRIYLSGNLLNQMKIRPRLSTLDCMTKRQGKLAHNQLKIRKDETKIAGHWIFDGSTMVSDDNCKRIDWLRSSYLKLVAIHHSGWLGLYQDPEDKRYWQLIFEYGEMQGGGPPTLTLLTEGQAKEILSKDRPSQEWHLP